jgi:hypothetical protein
MILRLRVVEKDSIFRSHELLLTIFVWNNSRQSRLGSALLASSKEPSRT